MSKTQLFIPDKIRVGWQEREGTYQNRLAYVIYYDAKGKLRKEASWKNWIHEPGKEYGWGTNKHIIDDSFAPKDFDNTPQSGFVLNKGVGGVRESYGWNPRNEYIRIWDPRGIEFEISIANMIFILMHTNCVKRQLEGEFVYSWEGKELLLLPVGTDEYKASSKFTSLQGKSFSLRDLEEGCLYELKNQKTRVYLGRFDYFEQQSKYDYTRHRYNQAYKSGRKHIFIDPDSKVIEAMTSASNIARKIGERVDNYAELLDVYKANPRSAKIVRVTLDTDLDIDKIMSDLNDPTRGYYHRNVNLYTKQFGHIQLLRVVKRSEYRTGEGYVTTPFYDLEFGNRIAFNENRGLSEEYNSSKTLVGGFKNLSEDELRKHLASGNVGYLCGVREDGTIIKLQNTYAL